MSVEANLARAIELDDEFPDDVCPGCQRNIKGWERYAGHYKSHAIRHKVHSLTPWPFVAALGPYVRAVGCVWTRDYLNARRFRREYIARHREVAA